MKFFKFALLLMSALLIFMCSCGNEAPKSSVDDDNDDDESHSDVNILEMLSPNIRKYNEKSRVGKDISALDSVYTAVKAETTDEVLSKLSTDDPETGQIEGISIEEIASATSGDLGTLSSRLFGKNKALGDAFESSDFLESDVAKDNNAIVMIYLDGMGGICVAAIGSDGNIVDYEGQQFVVGNIHENDILG